MRNAGAIGGLLAGAALGAAAMGGAALLLYTQQGFLATAGFLAALCLAALAAGAWAGSGEVDQAEEDGYERSLSRAWTATVLALGVAAAFSALWTVRPQLRELGVGSAAAALLLLAAPAYTLGQALARLAQRHTGVAMTALLGAAAGVLAAAAWIIPRFDAPYLFLGAGLASAAAAPLTGRRSAEPAERRMKTVVIVTGAGDPGQVGYTIAETFLAGGADVVISDVVDGVTELAGRLGDGVLGFRADLTRPEEAERLVAAALERFGRIDALVNVAGGLGVINTVDDTSAAAWSREIERNATTAFVMTRAALPSLRRSRGAVVNFASPAGLRGAPRLAAYSAAKAAVVAFTRALAVEERRNGVRVNAIAPGMVDTVQNRSGAGADQRFVSRADIAQVALYLTGSGAAAISGETIQVLGDTLE